MLGSDTMATRTGGVYALKRLSQDHAGEYHIQAMELLCAFVRSPPLVDDPKEPLREDVRAALDAIGKRSDEVVEVEREVDFRIDLRGAPLRGAFLAQANLREV